MSWPRITSSAIVAFSLIATSALSVPPDGVPGPVLSRQVPRTDTELGANPAPVALRPIGEMGKSYGLTGGDKCSGATPVMVIAGPPGSPNTVTITGDSSLATGPECGGLRDAWWEAFTLDTCAHVTIDFCGTNPTLLPNYVSLATDCSADGASCGGFIGWNGGGRESCPNPTSDSNIFMLFRELPPNTYYYPLIADGLGDNAPGPYVMHVTAEQCTGACSGCLGACCDPVGQTCVDALDPAACPAPDLLWTPRARCCAVECRDPAGPEFDSLDVNLLSRVTIGDLAAFNPTPGDPHTANEMSGYTSPLGREYAIIGLTNGTGFVDVTEPRSPVIVDFIPGTVDTIWRDMDTLGPYAYVVTDGSGVGLETFDLSEIDHGVITPQGIAAGGMRTAHNFFVNKASRRGYACGAAPFGHGFVIFSLGDPANPVPIGSWEDRLVHDLHVVSYEACPSSAGHIRSGQPCEIAFAFAGFDGIIILDVTDPASIIRVSTLTYKTLGYCHQGSLSADRRHVFFNDELDESFGTVTNTRTYVADVHNLSSPVLVEQFDHPGCWIDHNLDLRGDRVYQAHYAAGLRVLDAADPINLAEIAYFDTRPEDNAQDFPGAWGVFSRYASRIVTLSDRQRGLFVLCDEPSRPIAGFVVDQNPGLSRVRMSMTATGSTSCDPARRLTTYEWDLDYDGKIFNVDAIGRRVTHIYKAVGIHTVALRVTDDHAGQDVATLDIMVDLPPKACFRPGRHGMDRIDPNCATQRNQERR